MLDLRSIINDNPSVLNDRNSLREQLISLYPNEIKSINVVLAVYECGISKEIMSLSVLNRNKLDEYIQRLVIEYGLQDRVAYVGIKIWASAYNIKIDFHSEFTDTSNVSSEYDIIKTDQGYFIKKFKGFDDRIITVPHVIGDNKIVGICESAYAGCVSINELIISYGIEYIDNDAFRGCKNITKVSLPHTLRTLGSPNAKKTTGVFMNTKIESIVLPYGLEYIGNEAFYMCRELKEISIPDTVLEIGSNIFHKCNKLKNVKLSSRLKIIPEDAFKQCSSLEELIIPYGIETIDAGAFNMDGEYRNQLSSVYIPPTVCTIGRKSAISSFFNEQWHGVFYNCNKLTIFCDAGSYAMEYARENNIICTKAESLY